MKAWYVDGFHDDDLVWASKQYSTMLSGICLATLVQSLLWLLSSPYAHHPLRVVVLASLFLPGALLVKYWRLPKRGMLESIASIIIYIVWSSSWIDPSIRFFLYLSRYGLMAATLVNLAGSYCHRFIRFILLFSAFLRLINNSDASLQKVTSSLQPLSFW
jgi:hypothetical protein